MSNNVSFIIQLKDQFSKNANKLKRSMGDIKKQVAKTGSGFVRFKDKAKDSLISIKSESEKLKRKLTDVGKSLTLRLTAPIAALGAVSISQSAKLETLRVSLETMTKSAEKGAILMEKLVQFTAKTPFKLDQVGIAAKKLLAFGVVQDDIIDRMGLLGDISASANVPIGDLAQIFGKAKAKGKLMTEEILQLSERGVPIVDELAKSFNVSKNEIFEMASKSKISFDVMKSALQNMTTEGGIFFKGMEKQSLTLGGVFSTLQDNMGLTSGVIGDIIVDVFNLKENTVKLTNVFAKMREKIKVFSELHPRLTKLIAGFVLFLAVVGPALIVVGQMAIGLVALKFAFAGLAIAIGTISLPMIAIAAGIALLITGAVLLWDNMDSITTSIGGAWDWLTGKIVKSVNYVKETIQEVKSAFSFGLGNLGGDIKTRKEIMLSSKAPTTPLQNQKNPELQGEIMVRMMDGLTSAGSKAKTQGNSVSLNTGLAMAASAI